MSYSHKIGLQFDGWKDYMERLDKVGGSAAMKVAAEKAILESRDYVAEKIEKAMGKLPAGGRYSTGLTKSSIVKDYPFVWTGDQGYAEVGFDFDVSDLTSMYLMYGTPRMDPVKGLKAAIYGSKTKKDVAKIQEEIVAEAIRKIMEG